MEMGHDSPDLPIGMVTTFHLNRCKKTSHSLLSFFPLQFTKRMTSNIYDQVRRLS